MGLFQVFVAYFVFITLFFHTDALTSLTTDLNSSTNENKTSEKTLVNKIARNVQNVGLNGHLDSKIRKEKRPLNLRIDSKGPLKELDSNLKRKSTHMPLNFAIDTKPRTIPIKIPLVIKTANAKPGPAHYKRLKGDTERKKTLKHNSNKETARKKVIPIDVGTLKSSHRHTPKSSHFFEEDVESMPPVSKPSSHKKQKISANKTDIPIDLNSQNFIDIDIKQRVLQIEPDNDSNKTIHIKNGTHSMNIMKLPEPVTQKPRLDVELRIPARDTNHTIPEPISSETESKTLNEKEVDEKLQGNVTNNTPLTLIPEEKKELSTSRNEDNAIGVMPSEYDNQHTTNKPENSMEPLKEYPIVTVDEGIDLSDIITIKDQKYEECEEITRRNVNSEPIIVTENLNDPWETQSLNTEYPYDNAFQSDQTANEKYLNCMADNNPSIYDTGNAILEPAVTSPEIEEIQDIIYGQRLETPNNVIDICPENVLGRVWRRWKNTEVKIRKPYYGINRSVQMGRNWNAPNYGEVNPKISPQYEKQAVVNGYYNKNNVWPYSSNKSIHIVRCL